MNKRVLIKKISAQTGIRKEDVERVLASVYDVFVDTLRKGDEISIRGVGRMFTKERAEREYISFQTGQRERAPRALVPVVKFSPEFIKKF